MKKYDSEDDEENEQSDRYPIRDVIREKAKRKIKPDNVVERPHNHKEYEIRTSKSNNFILIYFNIT